MEESKQEQILVAIAKLETTVLHMNSNLEQMGKFSDMTLRNQEALKSAHKRIGELNDEIDALKDNNKWIVRTVGAALIMALLGLILGVN